MEVDADLKERIANQERSFEGMMSLIPADLYYGRDTSDQWKKKKQTKEEKRAAKMAKLQPGAVKSALDVHNENQLKRKRDEEGDEVPHSSSAATPTTTTDSKKQKKDHKRQSISQDDEESLRQAKAEKRKAKRQEKNARKSKKKEKKAAKKAARVDQSEHTTSKSFAKEEDNQEDEQDDDLAPLDVSGLEAEEVDEDDQESSASDLSEDESGPFDDATNASSASSSSSIVPSATEPEPKTHSKQPASSLNVPLSIDTDVVSQSEEDGDDAEEWEDEQYEQKASKQPPSAKKTKALNLPNVDTATLQARLADRLAAFRAARNADGLDGRPARSRAELIDARRRKEEQRKAHKKELRAKARLAKDAEEEAARLRGGSGSPLWSPGNMPSMRKEDEENRFSFGRVAFEDGAELDPSLSGVREARKKKGPQDVKTALAAAQKKASRLAGYDETKRADIAEKDIWLNASKRAHGEKVRDNAGLLKKSVKRQDKLKAKSDQAWQGRIDAVRQGKEAKQRRREENLAKRRDEKKRGKKKGAGGSVRYGIQFGGVTKKVGGKAKKRPGFEGTFKGSRGSRV